MDNNVKLVCDRCRKLINGIWEKNGKHPHTCGFYDVSDSYWKQYSNKREQIICDNCMISDPRYQKIYGITNTVKT